MGQIKFYQDVASGAWNYAAPNYATLQTAATLVGVTFAGNPLAQQIFGASATPTTYDVRAQHRGIETGYIVAVRVSSTGAADNCFISFNSQEGF